MQPLRLNAIGEQDNYSQNSRRDFNDQRDNGMMSPRSNYMESQVNDSNTSVRRSGGQRSQVQGDHEGSIRKVSVYESYDSRDGPNNTSNQNRPPVPASVGPELFPAPPQRNSLNSRNQPNSSHRDNQESIRQRSNSNSNGTGSRLVIGLQESLLHFLFSYGIMHLHLVFHAL